MAQQDLTPAPKKPAQRSWRRLVLQLVLWALALLLLVWVISQVPLEDILAILAQLKLWEITLLLLVNASIIVFFGLRWWLILRALGHSISYISVTRYRLAAFGVSYFTPGPHFGGEPLQVYYLRQKHAVPGTTAVASLALDKTFELLANFAFLVFGIALVLSSGVFGSLADTGALPLSLILLVLPLVYLVLLWGQRQPLSALVRLMPGRWGQRLVELFKSIEGQMNVFCLQHPVVLMQSVLISGLVWVALIFEYWLALRFLGVSMNFVEIMGIMTAARIALLTPLPGALGALEASQVLAMQALGLEAAFGLGIGLLIRARDVLFSLLGLIWGLLIRD
ncbi:MAG: flippase-like domain-containing protein [Chloroflexi bacterium]|nr:flippase-like domain-containing protein [Chloroflexota bacterium]